MASILITGAKGFIGKNLTLFFMNLGYEIIEIDIDHSEAELISGIQKADFIFHLAGVNRSNNEEDFQAGNVDFTSKLIHFIESQHKNIPLIVSSSTQALLDNPYGQSKKAMEDLLLDWAKRTHHKVFIFRLTNVFGKWCKPNYNSVVATFCYNLSHGIPITMDEPDKMLRLCYIDDIAASFLDVLEKAEYLQTDYYEVTPVHYITLFELAQTIASFYDIQKKSLVPNLNSHFAKALYATYLSYLEPSAIDYTLEIHEDSRGRLSEFLKSKYFGQIFISTTKPGITRGNHWHHTKTEKFLVIKGSAIISLRKIDSSILTTYAVSDQKFEVIDIPPGYTHRITNVGTEDLITLFWASEIFDPNHPDTYSEEV